MEDSDQDVENSVSENSCTFRENIRQKGRGQTFNAVSLQTRQEVFQGNGAKGVGKIEGDHGQTALQGPGYIKLELEDADKKLRTAARGYSVHDDVVRAETGKKAGMPITRWRRRKGMSQKVHDAPAEQLQANFVQGFQVRDRAPVGGISTARVPFRHHGNVHQVQPSRPYRWPNLGKNAGQEVRMVAEMNSHGLHLFHKGSSQARFTPDCSRYTAVRSP